MARSRVAAGEPFKFGVVRRLPHDMLISVGRGVRLLHQTACARNQYPLSRKRID